VVNHVSTDTTKNIQTLQAITRDSVFIFKRDSIFIHAKNDTVFIEKWRTEYQRIIHHDTVHRSDTVYQTKTDTLTETKTIEVKKPLNWWQKTLIGNGLITLLIGIIIGIYKIYKSKSKIKNCYHGRSIN
jgi:hypothetical protein